MGLEDLDQICQGVADCQCDKDSGDFYACLRPILILGRIIGILPITGVFHSADESNNKNLTQIGFGYVLVLLIVEFKLTSSKFSDGIQFQLFAVSLFY